MNSVKLTLACVFLSLTVSAQRFGSHSVAVIPAEPEPIPYNEESYRNSMKERYQGVFNRESQLNTYIDLNASARGNLFESNYIYTNWHEASQYIDTILKVCVPLKDNDNSIRAFVVRDADLNAAMYEDGTMIVNAGLLAAVESEAELAAILAHEYGHFKSRHNVNDYRRRIQTDRTVNIGNQFGLIGGLVNLASYSKYMSHHVDDETEADFIAFDVIAQRGYDPAAFTNMFTKMQDVELKRAKLLTFSLPLLYFRTHPSNPQRIYNAQSAFEMMDHTKGKQFFYDSTTFMRVRQRAIDECIYLLFENKEYLPCVEAAYVQHLLHPYDDFYPFYITESLKRQIAYFPKARTELFITARYKLDKPGGYLPPPDKIISQEKFLNKSAYLNTIFYRHTEIFGFSLKQWNSFPKNRLLNNDTIEFVTNADAYSYFLSRMNANCYAKRLCEKEPSPVSKPDSVLTEPESLYFAISKLLAKPADLSTSNRTHVEVPYFSFRESSNSFDIPNKDVVAIMQKEYKEYFATQATDSLMFHSHLSFGVEQNIRNSCKRLIANEGSPIDIFAAEPQLYQYAKENRFSKIIMADVPVSYWTGVNVVQQAKYHVYLIDLKKKTIVKKSGKAKSYNLDNYNWLFKKLQATYKKVGN